MFDFLSCGFGSVIGGLFTALIVAGGLIAWSLQASRGSMNPVALILSVILFCVLFFQTTLMYSAIGSKSVVMDLISACHFQFGNDINGAELKETVTKLIRENPLISFFVDYADLEDFDWTQPIKSLRSVVAREYNWYIFRRVVWSLVFTALTFGCLIFIGGGETVSRRRATTTSRVGTERRARRRRPASRR